MPTSQMVIAHIPLAYERNGIQSLELFKFLEAGRLTGKWKLQAWASCLSLQMLCTAYIILHHLIYVYVSLHVYMYYIYTLVSTIYILRCSPNASIRLNTSSAHHTLSVLLSCGRYRQSWLLGGCDLEVELEGIAFYFSFPFDCWLEMWSKSHISWFSLQVTTTANGSFLASNMRWPMSALIDFVDIELKEGLNLYEDMSFKCQRWVDAKSICAPYLHSEIIWHA